MNKIDIFNKFLLANKLNGKCIGMIKKGHTDIFSLQIENNFRLNKLDLLSKELMLVLKSHSIPSIKTDIESGLLQVETLAGNIPDTNLIKLLSNSNSNKLEINLGTSFKGDLIQIELDKNPHMLIGGSTGSGKSSLLHTIISNLLLKTESDIHIVDTKIIEFSWYKKFKRISLIHDYDNYKNLLYYLLDIMENRYEFLKNNNVDLLNNNYFKPITIIIDEFADLMTQKDKDCYSLLCKLIQKCRAAGIYCILATQRPSVDIITGVIKANFPARIACKVSSKTDSRIILDNNGAEVLNNIGEVIINNYKYNLEKFKVAYSSLTDIKNFLNEKMAPH